MSYWRNIPENYRDRKTRRLPAYLANNFVMELDLRTALKDTDMSESKATKVAKATEKNKDRRKARIAALRSSDDSDDDADFTTTTTAPKTTKRSSATKTKKTKRAPRSKRTYSSPSFGSTHSFTSTVSTTAIAGNIDISRWKFNTASTASQSTKDNLLKACWYEPGVVKGDNKPNVEICFSFDMTGSMSSCLGELRQKLTQTCTTLLGDLPNIRIAMIAHGDYCDTSAPNYVMKKLDFTNDLQCLENFVKSCNNSGGGDAPECYEMCLHEAQHLNWSRDTNCAKVLVMIGDDEPHKKNSSELKLDWKEEVENLKKLLSGPTGDDFRIYSIQCLKCDYANEFYQGMADMTGGSRFTLDSFSSIIEVFMGLCYRESAEMQFNERQTEIANAKEGESIVRPDKMDMEYLLSDEDIMNIHKAIHDSSVSSVTINGKTYDVSMGKAGCRFVNVDGITYIEQNKEKKTKYAKMAMEGKKITWICTSGSWGLVVDNSFVRRGAAAA